MPKPKKVEKRYEEYKKYNNKAAVALVDYIEELNTENNENNINTLILPENDDEKEKNSKKKLGMEEVNMLIQLYEDLGCELKNEYEEKEDTNKNEAESLKKTIKAFSKDYAALQRYKRMLETKSGACKMNIEEFYENSRTRTIEISEKEFSSLSSVGEGQNVRYKVNFIVEDEPVAGVQKGDAAVGFFTRSKTGDKKISALLLEEKSGQLKKELKEKYPGAKEFIKNLEYEDATIYGNGDTGLSQLLFRNPELFGASYGINTTKKMMKQTLSIKTGNEAEHAKNSLKAVKNQEQFYAYIDYVSAILKEKYALDIKEMNGIPLNSDISKRNALTSVMADILGCGEYFAYSEKMKIKTRKKGEDVTIDGVMMMPAKGHDPSAAGVESLMTKRDGNSYEDCKGMVKSIASIQFHDYITGNGDRHPGNLFLSFDKKGKVSEGMAIDNDACFGSYEEVGNLPYGPKISTLRIIPKSMADAVKNTKPEVLEVLMQGYGLSKPEIENTINRFKDLQQKLVMIEKAYKNVKDPLYIDKKIPRIVPDEEMDKFFVNEQLSHNDFRTSDSNLFGRIIAESDYKSGMGFAFNNLLYSGCKMSADFSKEYYGRLKRELQEFSDLNASVKQEKNYRKDALFENSAKACNKILQFEEKMPDMRLLANKESVCSKEMVKKCPQFSSFKKTVKQALDSLQKYIDDTTRKSFGGEESKYEEYLTTKAEIDLYKKEIANGKGNTALESGETFSDLLKESQKNLKRLENNAEVRKIKYALKMKEKLERVNEKIEKLDSTVTELQTCEKKCISMNATKDEKKHNPYLGSARQNEGKSLVGRQRISVVNKPRINGNIDEINGAGIKNNILNL